MAKGIINNAVLVALAVIVGSLLMACAGDTKENPYKETHLVTIMPNYQITPDATPHLKKPIEQMTEDELRTRYGELQKQSGLSAPQQKEFNMLAERLRELEQDTDRVVLKVRR